MNKISDKTVFKRKLEDQKKQDINPKVVKIILFSLIAILLAVIFVLPNFFENRNSLDKSNIWNLNAKSAKHIIDLICIYLCLLQT